MNRMQGGRGGTFRPPTNPGVGLLGHGPGGDDHMAQGGEGFRKMGGGMSSDPYRQVGGDQRQKPAMDGGMGQMRGGGMRSEMDRRPMEYSQEIDRRPMEYNQEVDHRPMGRTQEMDRRPMGRNQEIDRRPMEYSQEMDRRPMGHNQEVGRSQLDNQDGGMGSMRGGMDRPSMGRSQDLERRPMGRDSEMDHRPMGRELEMERRPMGRESDVDRRPMGRDSNMDRQPMGRDSDMDRRPMGRGLEMDRPMGRGAEMDRRPMGRGQMNTRGGGALGRGGGGDMDRRPMSRDHIDSHGGGAMGRGGGGDMDRRPMSRDHIDSHGGGAMGRGGGGDMDRRPMSRDHIDSHGVGSQMRGGSMRDEPQSLDTRRGDDRQMDRPRMDNQGGGMRSGPPKREPMVDSRSMDTTGQYDRGRTDSQGPGMRGDPDRRPPPKMGGHGNRPEMGAGMRDNPPPRDPMMDRRTGPMGQGRRPDGLNSRGNIPDRASGSVTSMDIGGRSMEQRPGFMDRRTDDGNQTAYPDQQRTLNDRQESFVGTTPQHFVDTPMNLPIIPQQQQMDSLITADQFTGMVYNVEQPNMNMLEQQLAQARRELVQRQQQAAALEAVQLNREKEEAMLRATMLQAQQKLKRSSRNEGPRGDGLLGSGPTGGRMPPPGAGRGGPGRGRPPPSLLNMPPMGRGKRLGIAADRFDDSKKPRREPPSTDRRPSNTAPQRPSRRDQQQDGARRKTRFDSSPLSKTRDRKDSDKSSSSQATSKGKDSVTSKAGATKAVVKDKSKETAVTITFSEQYDPTEPTGDIPGDTEEEPMDEDVKEAVKTEAGADKPKEMSLTVTINKKGRSVNDADKKPEVKKVLKCNICDVVCYDEMAFSRHMKSPRHLQKMQSVIDMSTQKTTQVLARKQAEQHLRSLETPTRPQPQRMPDGKTFESFCKTCEQNYTGAFKLHKETKMHKARDERRKAGCKICPVRTFNNYEDFAKHLQSTWHKKKEKQASWPHCKLCDQSFKSPRKFVQHCKTPHHIENKEKSKLSEDDEDLNEMVTLDTVGFEDDSPTLETMLKDHFARAQMHMPPPALASRYAVDDHHVSRYPPMTVPQPMRSPPPVLQSPQQSHTIVSPHSQHSLMPTYEEPRSVVSRFLDEIVPEPAETDPASRGQVSHPSLPHRTSQSESSIPSDIGSNIDLNEGIAVDHGDCPLPPTDANFEAIVNEKLQKGCGCSMECYKKYPHKAVYEHILDIREMGKYERELYIMGALSELEINDLETNQRGGQRQRVRHFYMHCGEKVCRTAFMVIYDIGYAALESIRKHVRTTGVSPRVHGNLGKSHKTKDEEAEAVAGVAGVAGKEPKKKRLKLDITMKEEALDHHTLDHHAVPGTSGEQHRNGDEVVDPLLLPIQLNPVIEEQVSQVLKEIEHMEKEGINGNTIDPNPIMPELSESQKFHEKMKKGCGCKLDCLRKFPPSVIYGHILDIREMSRVEREMYVMVALSSGDEDLKELTQKGTKRLRMLHDYMHMGYKICKYTFMVIYDIGDHQLKNLQRHIASKGITPRIHASKGKKPWHAITSDDIKRACNFINNFTEIVGTPQPSAPRVGPDNQTLILLPMGTRKKDVHGRYTERCHELEVRAVKYSTFITIWKKCLKHIQIPEPDTKGRKIEPLKCKMSPDRMSLDGGMSIDGRMSVDSRMSVDGHITVDGRMSVGMDGRMSVGMDGRMSVGLDGRMSVHDGRMSVDSRLPDVRMPDRI